jgi:DNA processing protein
MQVPTRSTEGLLTLLNFRGVGPRLAIALAKRFTTLQQIYESNDLERTVGISVTRTIRASGALSEARDEAAHSIDAALSKNVNIVHCFCSQYPNFLRSITDFPPVVFIKGQLRPDNRYVACVGTREPSTFGVTVSERITKVLVENNWGIVSGLAVGVDSECHRAALVAGGHTVAVLANGLDTVYPKRNEKLAHKIIESGGALLSEQPIGMRVTGPNLVKRDRIQSGMSLATFVMQTDIMGGTMHTVRFTLEQRRLLFAPVPTVRYSEDIKSMGIRAIVEKNGSQLADLLQADKGFRKLLFESFGTCAPAIPIRSSIDYPAILHQLEAVYSETGRDTEPVIDRLF